VIRAILRAPVDLLWNGGIGTVVKASDETDADAMDRASDAIRVDASDLRCKVVGEGGNLGFTRRARVEFSREGGRINADFIDNSAGVDCSDHEVNLKILLGLAERHAELDRPARDALLLEVTDAVVEHVLYDSFLQAQILAQEVVVSPSRMYAYEDLMSALESDGLLDRASEKLPGTEEMAERRRAGRGLERPEFASQLAAERGAEGADVVRAYRIAREVTGADARWDSVEALGGKVDRRVQTELMAGVDRLVEATARWYLAHDTGTGMEQQIAAAEAPFARLIAVLPEIGQEDWRAHRGEVAEKLEEAGVPEEVAWAHTLTPELMQAPDILAVAEDTGRPVEEVTHAFHELAARLDIVWLLGALDELPQPTRTQRWAVQAVREDCLDALAQLARCALVGGADGAAPKAAVDAYLAARPKLSRRLAAVTASLSVEGTGDLPALMLAVRALRALAD
jgi:glutamate dehydrogenase